MLQNYLKTIIRHIGRNMVNFGFKLGGLSLVIFSLLVIVLYVSYQLSYDRFHTEHENIYRVNSNRDEDGKQVGYSMVPPAIGPALKEGFPEIVAYARTGVSSRVTIQYKDKLLRMTGFVEADSSIFDVLSFNFIQGNSEALYQPGSVVLTQSIAMQIFGDEDPINKIITSPDHANRMLTVRGIIEDYPQNSHMNINAIHSMGALIDADPNSWEITWDGSVNLFVKLRPGSNLSDLTDKVQPVLQKNLVKREDGSEKGFSIYFQPITSIYLDPVLKMEFNKKGSSLYVYLFSVLGIFLLTIGCINYINLSIADLDTRTRDIAVRKILGAGKMQIGMHVALESLIITFLALLMATFSLYLAFPFVAQILEPNLHFSMLLNKDLFVTTTLLFVMIAILSAAYPSYQLAVRKLTDAMKPGGGAIGNHLSMGKILLLAQCVISIICICMTLMIGKQLSYIQNKDVGYDRNRVISLVLPEEYPSERIPLLKSEIARLAGVEAVSYSYYLMPISTYFKDWYKVEKNGKMEKTLLNEMFVDVDYFETMGIHLVEGRNFLPGAVSDIRSAFIINETAAKEFGWANPIGKRMSYGFSDQSDVVTEGTVVGVVKDFNTLSLHKAIEPVVMRLQYDNWPGNSLNVRVQGRVEDMLPVVVSTYEKVMPGFLADARVVDDLFQRQYQNENKAFSTMQIATAVIIVISAFGIFSLSLYMSIRRMKEFGIRKVLGATMREIATLHVNYFLKIVLIANVIALPFSYWLMTEWLRGFAYQTNLAVVILLVVALTSFLLVVLSGGFPAWKAGRMNPVDVIKSE